MGSMTLKERLMCRQLGFDDIDPSFCNTQVGWVAPDTGKNLYIWHPGGVKEANEFVRRLRNANCVAWVVPN